MNRFKSILNKSPVPLIPKTTTSVTTSTEEVTQNVYPKKV